MKIKTLIQNLVFSTRSWVAHVLVKAKTSVMETVEEARRKNMHVLVPFLSKKNRSRNKVYLGSFRLLHYHWNPTNFVPQSSIHGHDGSKGYVYKRDSYEEEIAQELTGYLRWLEEKDDDSESEILEIDDLAEKYIANCHKKFILEKQESDRKYQDMMARLSL